jgi:SPP1 family predicted phage head-tail adaptor
MKKIGSLRHKITFQQLMYDQTETGGYTENLSGDEVLSEETPLDSAVRLDDFNVFANVQPLSGRELLLAAQTQAETTHKITIRYRPGLTTHFRIKFGTRIFRILSIINSEERNRWLQIHCVEVEGDSFV